MYTCHPFHVRFQCITQIKLEILHIYRIYDCFIDFRSFRFAHGKTNESNSKEYTDKKVDKNIRKMILGNGNF